VADQSIEAMILIAEYERLKEEQNSRIGFRDGLVYATLVAMAGVVAATFNAPQRTGLLLLLPPVCLLLGWTYLANDEKVSAIGRYLRTDLAVRLAPLVSEGTVIFGWEVAHRVDARRRSRKALQMGLDLATFCLPALIALIIFWVSVPPGWPFLAVSAAEALAALGLASQIVWYADLGARG
jgi:hypothetical protein